MQRSVKYLLPAFLALFPSGAVGAVTCTVSTVPVAFGSYVPSLGTPTDGVGTININCDKAPASNPISISAGRSGSFTSRTMSNGKSNLSYNLYTSAARTQVWGDGTGGSAKVSYGGGGAKTFAITVYGRITALQNVTAGSYSDSLLVTISF